MARALRRESVSTSTPPEWPPLLETLGEPFTLSATAWTAWVAAVNGNGHAPPPTKRSRRLRTVVVTAWIVFLAGTALAFGFDRLSAPQLLPGTRIGGVVVGSRSLDEAAAVLNERVVRPLQTEPLTLRAHTTLHASPWDIGVRIDVDRAVGDVHQRQHATPLITRLWRRVLGDETSYPLSADVSQSRVHAFLAAAAKKVDRPVRDATVEVKDEVLEVIPHQVGRRLDLEKAGTRLVGALRAGDADIRLPVELTQPELRTEQFDKVVLVHTAINRLDFYVGGKLDRSFPVATGTPGYPTPHGQFHITSKRRNPTWGNPWAPWSMDMPAFIGPGPGNPLGTRAMNLSVGGIRIHGSPDAASIGRPASHGCIRMHLRDAETLFELVDVGTPVIIVGA